MPTRNVVLTDHQNDLIDRLVASGRYQNASEVMRAGVRILEKEEEERQAIVNRLTASIHEFETHGALEEPAETTIRNAFDQAIAQAVKDNGPDAA